jgi:integrase
MARRIRYSVLETREARSRLKPNGKPYFREIEQGLHLGYRKPRGRKGKPGGAGSWVERQNVGGKHKQPYVTKTFAIADDLSDADGVAVLNYWQAQNKARERWVRRVHDANGVHGPLTVGRVLDDYVAFLAAHRKTARDAKLRIEALIRPALGNITADSLTVEVLRAWHAGLAKTPPRARTAKGAAKQNFRDTTSDPDAERRRKATANRTLVVLKAALNRAWRDGRVASDAAWRRVEPFAGADAARQHWLTIAEAQRLINASAPEFRPLVQAALQSGCRYGELIRLTVADFNADAGTVAIRTSKSGKARYVILSDEGRIFFERLCAGRKGSEIMLTKRGKPWGTGHQGPFMRAACQGARISPPISFHALRHTWASLAVMARMPLMVVARNLGHRDTRQIEKHYGHLEQSYVENAVREHAPRFGFQSDTTVVPIERRK